MKHALISFSVALTVGCSSYPTKINDNTNLLGTQIEIQTSVQDLISKFGEPESQLTTGNETLFTFCERKGDVVDILYVLGKNDQVVDTKRTYYSIGIFDSANVPCSERLTPPESVEGKIAWRDLLKERCEAAVPKQEVQACLTKSRESAERRARESEEFNNTFLPNLLIWVK
jgi:hypothetical protein